jgi:hypothetical protein
VQLGEGGNAVGQGGLQGLGEATGRASVVLDAGVEEFANGVVEGVSEVGTALLKVI